MARVPGLQSAAHWASRPISNLGGDGRPHRRAAEKASILFGHHSSGVTGSVSTGQEGAHVLSPIPESTLRCQIHRATWPCPGSPPMHPSDIGNLQKRGDDQPGSRAEQDLGWRGGRQRAGHTEERAEGSGQQNKLEAAKG